MRLPRFTLAVMAAALFSTPVLAERLNTVPAITNPVVKKECGACHMAYQPKFLGASTWDKILGDLSHHFGEDASLPPQTVDTIKAYYDANAGDSLPGLLRITQQSWWLMRHGGVGHTRFAAAKSKANCLACHKNADKGEYPLD